MITDIIISEDRPSLRDVSWQGKGGHESRGRIREARLRV